MTPVPKPKPLETEEAVQSIATVEQRNCIHFNGTKHTQCAAGVVYKDLAGGDQQPGWTVVLPCFATRVPAFADSDEKALATCAHVRFLTRSEAEDKARAVVARLLHRSEQIAKGICPTCNSPATFTEVGRCRYAQPCGCRLGQYK